MPLEKIGEIDLPYEAIKDTKGFAFDFGGSVIKVTYIHKDDWKAAINNKSSAKVQLVSFSRTEFKDALEFVEKNVEVPREKEDETVEVFLTGVGCNFYKEDIEKKFNVKIKLLPEFDCFVRSFIYLMRILPEEKFVMEPSKEGVEKSMAKYKMMMESMGQFFEKTDMQTSEGFKLPGKDDPLPQTPKVDLKDPDEVYPTVLAMCGSAFGFFLIQKDGTFSAIEGSNRGGRTFLGLANLITGVKTFPEIMALAEKGNSRNVDTYPNDIMKSNGDDMYSELGDKFDLPVYGFGNTYMADPEKFKKEDLLRALACHSCTDVTSLINMAANYHKAKSIFFCGSFLNAPLIRELITDELNFKVEIGKLTPNATCKQFHFLQAGSHLGSLGAFLNVKLEEEKAGYSPLQKVEENN